MYPLKPLNDSLELQLSYERFVQNVDIEVNSELESIGFRDPVLEDYIKYIEQKGGKGQKIGGVFAYKLLSEANGEYLPIVSQEVYENINFAITQVSDFVERWSAKIQREDPVFVQYIGKLADAFSDQKGKIYGSSIMISAYLSAQEITNKKEGEKSDSIKQREKQIHKTAYTTTSKIEQAQVSLEKAIEEERYEDAAKIKKEMDKLTKSGE